MMCGKSETSFFRSFLAKHYLYHKEVPSVVSMFQYFFLPSIPPYVYEYRLKLYIALNDKVDHSCSISFNNSSEGVIKTWEYLRWRGLQQ